MGIKKCVKYKNCDDEFKEAQIKIKIKSFS